MAEETLNNEVDNHPMNISQPLSPAIACLVQLAHVDSDNYINDGGYPRAECMHLFSPELIWPLHF